MPAVTSGKVLVTGANGFIAGWIVKDLLDHGFAVRGTVRSAAKADALREALATYGDLLQFVVVEDITESGAFNEAVQGIDVIIHTASPAHISAHDPDELIRPAVLGTTGILHSASLPASSIKRVIVLSSLPAVVDTGGTPAPGTYTEADWNEQDVVEVRELGAAASQPGKYRASKVLAERAAWDLFAEGRKSGTIGWDLVTLCPPWVFGPVLGARLPKDLCLSVKMWYELAVKEEGEIPEWTKANWTDVRDLAAATRLALTKPEAGGERFIICAGPSVWRHWVSVARRILKKSTPEEVVEEVSAAAHDVRIDNTKSREVLGLQYRNMEATAGFMIEDFKQKGWC
ncbi:hypothetical protein V8D89_012562 [Ganoderma adspersum]